ncbi:hypothetical protein [Flavobacterium sp.]|uniref:hypothetical protein n=1 Tax=Flavobacterium sp. TaxID=239 RepID=UPI002D154FAC|nr:hypothetical protein [Flavobacterium sp.]HSD08289.1 hypothetical protein [Flavobacterium sp.]
MTINKTYFWIIIILIIVFLIYQLLKIGDFEKFTEKQKQKANYIILSGALILIYLGVMFSAFFPNIYVIENCDNYHSEILIFPKTTEKGLNLTFGDDHCYVLNESDNNINIKTLIYSQPNYKPVIFFKTLDEVLNAKSEKQFEIGYFDFICETPDNKVLSKGSQSYMNAINCN